jgi:hypothetical protein
MDDRDKDSTVVLRYLVGRPLAATEVYEAFGNAVALELEPVVVGVMAADVRVDRRRHRRNVADAGNVPRHHHQPG